MKENITETEYLSLIGLQTVGLNLKKQIDNIVNSISEIIGEEDEYKDWSHEFIWAERSVDDILNSLKIEVLDE